MIKLLFRLFRKFKALEERDRQNVLRKKYLLPRSFRFNGENIQFYGDGELRIGENTYIGGLSTIQLDSECFVEIGIGCSISHNVRMYTTSKVPDGDFKDKQMVPEKRGNIVIGNYVWIGVNVYINPGVTIGDNAVIGANSVVTTNIEPFTIYGGVPAKLIRTKRINA
jgi:maltose O-acetyltransferase